MNNRYLDEMFPRARNTSERAVSDFGGLDGAALNWQVSPGSWSIAQCLDHLITTDELYYPQFQEIAEGRKQSTVWERIPLLPRATGALFRWSLNPGNRIRIKTSSVFEPRSSVPDTIVSDFARDTERLLASIAATDGVEHDRLVITSPAAKFISYPLKDVVIFLILHLERHRRQAEAVQRHPDFPG